MTTTGTFLEEIERQRKEIAELREKLALRNSFIANQTHAVKLDHELFEELREKLAAAEARVKELESRRG